jgi:putative oxidoreductase
LLSGTGPRLRQFDQPAFPWQSSLLVKPVENKGARVKQWIFNNFIGGRVAIGLFLLRVVVGAAFMFHGYGKIQHPFSWMGEHADTPGWLQALAALSEFGGGAAWILGLLTPIASLGILCTMTTAVHMHLMVRHDPFVATKGGPGYEPALVYLCIALLLLLAGPGKLSLDALIFGRKRPA